MDESKLTPNIIKGMWALTMDRAREIAAEFEGRANKKGRKSNELYAAWALLDGVPIPAKQEKAKGKAKGVRPF